MNEDTCQHILIKACEKIRKIGDYSHKSPEKPNIHQILKLIYSLKSILKNLKEYFRIINSNKLNTHFKLKKII